MIYIFYLLLLLTISAYCSEKVSYQDFDLVKASFDETETLVKSHLQINLANHFFSRYRSNISIFYNPNIFAILKGHAYVRSVALSNDNTKALTGGGESCESPGIAILWDISNPSNPQILATLNGHTNEGPLNSVALSNDCSKALTASSGDCTPKLWDISNPAAPKILATLEGHEKTVSSVAISNDNSKALTGSDGGTAKLWDISNPAAPKLLITLMRNTHHSSVAISNDYTKALTGSYFNTAKLWDLSDPSSPKLLATLKDTTSSKFEIAIRSVAISNDNTKALTGSDDGTAKLWNISNPAETQLLATLKGHTDSVNSVALSSDNTKVLTGSEDSTAKLWDINNPTVPQLLASLKGHTSHVNSVALSNDNTKALTSSGYTIGGPGSAILWNLNPSNNLDSLQIQLLAKLATLKEYNQELDQADWTKIFNSLNSDTRSNVLRWVKKLPDGQIRKRKEEQDRLNKEQDRLKKEKKEKEEKNHIQDLQAIKDLQEKQGKVLVDIDFDLIKASFEQTQNLLKSHSEPTLVNYFQNKYRSDISNFLSPTTPITPKILHTLKGNIGDIHSIALGSIALGCGNTKALTYLHDETSKFSFFRHQTVKLWDISNPIAPQLLSTLEGHTKHVNSVVISSDNTKALIGSDDNTTKLWSITNPRAPQLLATLKGHTSYVLSVAISNDNTKALTGGSEGNNRPGTAVLWDISNPMEPKLLTTLKGHIQSVNSVAISNDNTKALTSSDDFTVKLWDISNPTIPQLLADLEGHTYMVCSVAISNDCRKVLTGSGDKTAKLWDITNPTIPQLLADLEGHTKSVLSVAISNDNTKALTGSDDNTTILWDISPNPNLDLFQIQLLAKLAKLKEYNQELDQADWAKIFNSLNNDIKSNVLQWIKKLSGGHIIKQFEERIKKIEHDKKNLELQRIKSEQDAKNEVKRKDDEAVAKRIKAENFDLIKLSFEQAQTLLKSHSQSALISYFLNEYRSDISNFFPSNNLAVPQLLSTLNVRAHVNSVALSNDNTKALIGSDNDTAELWDISNPIAPKLLATLTGHSDSSVNSAAPRDDNTKALLTDDSISKSNKMNKIAKNFLANLLSTKLSTVALSNDSTKALTCSSDNTVKLWDITNPSSPQLFSNLKGHIKCVNSVVLSNDNTKALTGSDDRTAKLWDISNPTNPQLLSTLKGHTFYVYSVALSNDNTKALTGSHDCTAKLWDVSNPTAPLLLTSLKDHSREIRSVALSNDNTKALTGSHDCTAKLWDISNPSTPQLLSTLKGHIGPVNSVSLSNDNTKALTGSNDNTAKLWNISNPTNPQLLSTLNGVKSVALSNDCSKALTGLSHNNNNAILWNISSNPYLDLSQIQLLAKLANLKEYNQELDQADWTKIFNSLNDDTIKSNVLQWVKKLPDGQVRKQKEEQDRLEKEQAEKKRLQDLQNEKQTKALADAEIEIKKFEQERLKFEEIEAKRIKAEEDSKNKTKELEQQLEEANKRLSESKKHKSFDYHKIEEILDQKLKQTLDQFSPNLKVEKDAADARKKVEDLEKQIAQLRLSILSSKSSDSKSNLELLESDSGFAVAQDLEKKLSQESKDSLKKSIKEKYSGFFKNISGDNTSTLRGHASAIKSVALSNNSKLAITGGDDNIARIWNIQNFNNPGETAALKAHNSNITSAAFSPDNETAYTASLDKTIYIWDLQDPTEPMKIKASNAINSLALCSGLLLSGQADNNAVLWNISRIPAKVKATLSGHTGPVNSVLFSYEGKLAFTGSDDRTARIWDLDKTQTSLHTLTGHTNSVKSVAISHDDKLVLTGSADNSAILWSMAKIASVVKASHLKGHTDSVNAVAFGRDDKLAFTGSSDSTVKIWNIEDPRNALNIRTITDHNNSVLAIAVNDRFLLTGCSDSLARLFNLNTVNLDNLNLVQLALFIKLANLNGLNRTAGLSQEDIKGYKDIISTLDMGVRGRVLEIYPEFRD